jgi:SAM-dependent methyltransferase
VEAISPSFVVYDIRNIRNKRNKQSHQPLHEPGLISQAQPCRWAFAGVDTLESVTGKTQPPRPGRRFTRNRMGWISEQISAQSGLFLDFCRAGHCASSESPALDIGTGYGLVALAALRAGAWVIANDVEPSHLRELERRAERETSPEERLRLVLRPGNFPRDLFFPEGALGAVHCANVLHFLTGRQLTLGMSRIARWLRPGGKLFVQASTPYRAPFAPFIEEYERRVAAGEKWPGWVEKLSAICTHRQVSQMPRAMHFLDDRILGRLAVEAGLTVERAWLAPGDDLPADLRLDGRETACLIARKIA